MAEMRRVLDEIDADPAVHVVVIAANGPAFCAGHDLKEIRTDPDRALYEELLDSCNRLMMRITTLRQPVIARVQGIATAAGCQLVATCDLAVASNAARFATPGVNIGLFCSTPMVALSRAVGRKAALEMLLTGEMVDAETAVAIGLVNRVVANEALDQAVAELADQIASKSPMVVAIGKKAFYKQIELGLTEAYDYAGGVMVTNLLKRDAAEGIDAFIEKRDPIWEGR
jgi:enoyl-CoA hydratase/carnithine racemase